MQARTQSVRYVLCGVGEAGSGGEHCDDGERTGEAVTQEHSQAPEKQWPKFSPTLLPFRVFPASSARFSPKRRRWETKG